MLYVLITAWVWWNNLLSLNRVSQNNQIRQEAQAQYQAGKYGRALSLYMYLAKNTTNIDPAVRLNLGHTYFKLKQYTKARPHYETLLRSERPDLRTAAATQLGVLACLEGDSAAALTLFQQALLENADNEPARYNFELIKSRYSGKIPPSKPDQAKNQPPETAQKNRSSDGGEVERSERQDEVLRRFRQLNLNEAQAMQLLDAMRGDDLPYALAKAAQPVKSKTKQTGNQW